LTGDPILGRLFGKCRETPRLHRRGTFIQAKGA
jgi:hypothetical protein